MASQTLPLTLWELRNETSQWHLDTCASRIFQLVPITPELSMCVHVSYPYPYYAIHAAVLKQDSENHSHWTIKVYGVNAM